jgi:hypothetical protein
MLSQFLTIQFIASESKSENNKQLFLWNEMEL